MFQKQVLILYFSINCYIYLIPFLSSLKRSCNHYYKHSSSSTTNSAAFLPYHHTHWQIPILVKTNYLHSLPLAEQLEMARRKLRTMLQFPNTIWQHYNFPSPYILPLSKTAFYIFLFSHLQLPLLSTHADVISPHFTNKIGISGKDFPCFFNH